MLLVTEHAMGWPAFAAAHDGGLYAGMVAAWVVGVLAALFWTFMLIMSEEGMLSGGAAAVATGVCCFLVIIPLFVVLPSYLAANLGLGAATTGDLVFCLACLALAVVLGFMLYCVAFRALPRPALHGRIGAASVATWVVPVVVAVVLLVDLWAELRKGGTGAGFAPFAVAAESLRLWALVYGAAAPLLALVLGSWLVTSRAALTTKLVVVPGSS